MNDIFQTPQAFHQPDFRPEAQLETTQSGLALNGGVLAAALIGGLAANHNVTTPPPPPLRKHTHAKGESIIDDG